MKFALVLILMVVAGALWLDDRQQRREVASLQTRLTETEDKLREAEAENQQLRSAMNLPPSSGGDSRHQPMPPRNDWFEKRLNESSGLLDKKGP